MEQSSELQTATPQDLPSSVPVRFQLRWNLIALLVILTVLPVILVLGITLFQSYLQTGTQIKQQLRSVAAVKRNEILRWLNDAESTLDVILANQNRLQQVLAFVRISFSDEFLEGDRASQLLINNLLSDAAKAQGLFEELFIYNANGRVIAATNPIQIGKVVTRQPYFTRSLANEDYIQPPYHEVGTGELIMITTHPLVDEENGEIIGVLAGRLNMDVIREIMTERAGLGDTGETYMVSAENGYLLTPSRFPGYRLERAYHSPGIDQVLAQQNEESGTGDYDNYQKPPTPVFGAFLWIPELQAGLLAEVAQTEALAPFVPTLIFSIGVASIFVLLAVVIGFYATNRISRPISQLTQVATQIAAGNLNHRAHIPQRNEIGLLARVFNQMTGQLQELIDSLEQRVTDRTRRLEIVATLGERLSAILDFNQLLSELVNQVKERFNYYHTQVYIIDDQRENLVIAAGVGEAGDQMKISGHKIPLNAPTSLVARAARTGEIVTVDNVREAPDWLPNPLLPDTYSEMAVPIVLEGQVVGVLDVQESQIAGLDEGDASLLRSLANQVAVAIRNARLFAEVEKALAEAHATQEQYLEQAWDGARIMRYSRGQVQFSQDETVLDNEIILAARQKALAYERIALVTFESGPAERSTAEAGHLNGSAQKKDYALVAPIKLRDVIIGNLQMHGLEPDRQWTEDDLALINAVVDQVAQAAENLRLLNETRERANRERLIGRVSDRLRRAPDLETLMKIGVEELSQILKPARTFVRLGFETELLAEQPGHPNQKTVNGQGDTLHE